MTGISNINITASGTLYTSAPTVTVSAPTLPAGDSARASGTLTVVDGQVTNFSLTDSGAYYLSAPEVEFQNVFNLNNLDSFAKWDSFSYQFGKDTTTDSDYGQYTNSFTVNTTFGSLIKNFVGVNTTIRFFKFNPTGTRVHFRRGQTGQLAYKDLSTAFDIGSLDDTYINQTISGTQTSFASADMEWNGDGTKVIFSDTTTSVIGSKHQRFTQFDLSTPYDITTIGSTPSFNYDIVADVTSAFDATTANNFEITSFKWNADGTKMIIFQSSFEDMLYEFSVSVPYDITSTKTWNTTKFDVDIFTRIDGSSSLISRVDFNDSGTSLYVIDGRTLNNGERTYRLNLNPAFDLSTLTVGDSINTDAIGGPDTAIFEHTAGNKIYAGAFDTRAEVNSRVTRTYSLTGGGTTNVTRNTDVKLEFWLYPDDSQKGDFLKFKGIGDSSEQDGSFNKVAINGKGLDWSFTSSDSTSSMSSLKLLKYDEWNFVQLRKTQKGSLDLHEIFINDSAGQLDSGVGTSISAREPFLKDKITLVNNSGIVGVHIDAIRLVKGSSPAPIISPPDSDRDPGDGINYDKFPVIPPQITPTITNNRVSGATVVTAGTRLISSTPVFAAPTGTPADFAATVEAVIDSSGVVTALNIIDSGDFYTAAPTISLTAPGQPAPGQPVPGFMIGEIVNQTLADGTIIRGEVVKWSDSDKKLHLVHVGGNDGKFHTFSTSSNHRLTGLKSLASGVITAVNEDNQLSANEQNDIFDGLDFIDFSENNPFGDPE